MGTFLPKSFCAVVFFLITSVTVFSQNLVPSSGTASVTTCSGTVTDHAGPGANYSNSVNGTLTINPQVAGNYVRLTFTTFQTESGYDYLRIYDGTSTSATLIGTWNGSTAPGTIYATNASGALTLNFYSDGSVTYEGFEATIACVATIPATDLTITSPSIGGITSTTAGSTLNTNFYVSNIGASSAPSSNAGVYLSTDAIWDAGDTYLNYSSGASLTAGQNSYRSLSTVIPSNTALGNYYILFYADYTNALAEDDETNNVVAMPVSVVATSVDLYITGTSISTTNLAAGSTATLYGSVYNQGNTSVSSVGTGYYLSTDAVWDINDVYLNYNTSSTISPGGYYSIGTSVTIPVGTSAGHYYIIYYADYTHSITEVQENNNTNLVSINVVQQSSDLQFASASVTTNSVAAGASTTFSFNFLNQGSAALSVSTGFYLSTDQTWDAGDTYLNYSNNGTVSGNAYYGSSSSLTIPAGTTPGTYYLIGFVDYTNANTETNETNNTYSVQITVTAPVVDLIIQSTTLSPATVIPGATTSATCYIYNQGNSTASSSSVGYYLSTDNLFDAGDVYLNYTTGSALAASNNSYRSATLTIPAGTAVGNYYILYYADYSGSVTESVETNNVSAMPITVASSTIDLVMQSMSNPAYSTAGSSINCTSYIANTGNTVASSSNVGYYLSTDAVFDAADVYLNYYSGGTLAANSSSYRSTTLTIPVSTTNGTYYILYYADYTNAVTESVENNNVSAVAIGIGLTLSSDLTIQTGQSVSPTQTSQGAIVSASCYIKNAGGTTSNTSNVGFYLSTDAVFDASDVYLNYYSGSSLTAGSTSYRSSSLTIPVATTPGNYYILFYADYTNAETEFDETNNVSAFAITVVTSSIDLIIQTQTLGVSSIAAGGIVNSSCYIANTGNSSASISNVGYYLSTDQIWDAGDTYLNYYSGSALNANSSSYRSSSLTIPAGTAAGNYYILFYADYTAAVTETNENNNVSSVALTVLTPAIDLKITGYSLNTYTSTPGATITANCYIYNQGNTSASSSNVGYYLSTDSIWSAADTYLNYYSGGTVSANGYSTRNSSVVIPAGTTPGSYYILYYADYSGAVTESNEANNVSALPITIATPYIDFQIISSSLAPSSPTVTIAGSTASLYFTIFNAGNADATTSSNTGFYLSTDTLWSAADTYLGATTVSSLAFYTSSTRNGSVTIPVGTTTGNYYIIFYADYAAAVTESIETNNFSYTPISIQAAVVDLTIVTPTLSTTSLAAGYTTNASSNIRNTGNTSVSTSNVGYYLSTDTIWTAADTYLNYTSGGTLNANTSSLRTATLTIPAGTAVGNYYILFYADYSGVISETSETNNVRYIAITVSTPYTDLSLQNPSLTTNNLPAGNSTSASVYIYNTGNISSSYSNVGYYLSSDTLWTAADTYLNYTSGSTLASGANGLRSATLTIPTGTSAGSYYILYFADYSNMVTESIETNNVKFLPITIQAANVDLIIQTPGLTVTAVAAGGTTSASCYIYNQGNSPAGISSVGFYLSANTVFDASDVFLNYQSGTTLAALTSAYRSSTLTIPAGTTPGSYYILYFADYLNAEVESVETNNVNYYAITVQSPTIDLYIQSQGVSTSTVAAGNSISATCYIYNQGNSAASTSDVGFYLSSNTVFDASDTYLNYYAGGTLNAGSNSYRSSTITIPAGTTPGTYYILYYADYASSVTETNETNNVAYYAITVQSPSIDLYIQSQSVSTSTITAGGSATASCYIYNQGNSTSNGSDVGYYLSANTVFDASDTYLNYSAGSTLAAGGSAYRSNTITIPAGTTPGTYYILYYADYASSITETNETNNVNYYAITVQAPSIDLYIQSQGVSTSTLTAGSSTSAYCYIYNQGNTSSTSSDVGYYLSANTVFDASDTYLNYTSGSALAASGSSYRSGTITIPANTTPGTYYVLFYADYGGNVSETNETNNVVYYAITVQAPAIDLYIQSQSVSTSSVAAGNSISATCYIYNQGNTVAATSDVGYYLSANTVFDASDVYMNYVAGGSLAAGGSSYRSSTITIPANTTPGTYYVLYYADYGGNVSETNETNNVNYYAITVVAPSVDLVPQTQGLSSNSLSAGSSTTASCYIYNQGTTTANTSDVGYYLSANTVFDGTDVYLNYSAGGTLGSSSSAYRGSTITIPSNTTPGSYYILYYADYAGNVSETNETNNVIYYAITVLAPSIDLLPQSVSSPTSSTAGASVNFSCYIYNQGNTSAATSNMGYYLSANNVYDASDVYLNSSVGGSLTSGSTSYRSVTATIPSNTTPGNYYILFYADYTGVETETNETNNVVAIAITIALPNIDLVITSPSLGNTTVYDGTVTSAACYVYNQGNTASSSSNVAYYLSSDNLWDAADVYLNYNSGGALGAASSNYLSNNLTIPQGTAAGNYYILFFADYSNNEAEVLETNNVSSVAITVVSSAGLLIIPFSGNNTYTTCTGVLYDNGITGNYANSSNGYTVLYPNGAGSKISLNFTSFQLESNYDYLYIYDGPSTSSTLLGTYNSFSPGVVTATNASGALTVQFISDGSVVYSGFSATVSCVASGSYSDLTFNYLDVSQTTIPQGSTITATSIASNAGNLAVSSSNIGYYLSTDAIWDAGDILITTGAVGYLAAGDTNNLSASLTMPAVTSGTYYILFFIDNNNAVVNESDESNNVQSVMVDITSLMGIRSQGSTASLLLYPNPANDFFNIELQSTVTGNQQIDIVNALGMEVYKTTANKNEENLKLQINTNLFAAGVYTVRISNDKETLLKKIIIK